MNSLNKISNNIRNYLRGGRATVNDYISLEQIKYNVNHYRALFLRRELRSDENLNYFEQDLSLPFKRKQETYWAGELKYKDYLQSDTLPSYVRLLHRTPLALFNSTQDTLIPISNNYTARYVGANRYNTGKKAYIVNNTIIVIDHKIQEEIRNSIVNGTELSEDAIQYCQDKSYIIRGVFDYPSEVYEINGVDPLEVDDQPYPISADIEQRITEGMINGNLKLLQIPTDTTQDNLPNQ